MLSESESIYRGDPEFAFYWDEDCRDYKDEDRPDYMDAIEDHKGLMSSIEKRINQYKINANASYNHKVYELLNDVLWYGYAFNTYELPSEEERQNLEKAMEKLREELIRIKNLKNK